MFKSIIKVSSAVAVVEAEPHLVVLPRSEFPISRAPVSVGSRIRQKKRLLALRLVAVAIQILENLRGHLKEQMPIAGHPLSRKRVVVGDPVVITLRQQLAAVGVRLMMSRKNLRAMVGVPRIPTTKHLIVEVGVPRIPTTKHLIVEVGVFRI